MQVVILNFQYSIVMDRYHYLNHDVLKNFQFAKLEDIPLYQDLHDTLKKIYKHLIQCRLSIIYFHRYSFSNKDIDDVHHELDLIDQSITKVHQIINKNK